MSTHIGWTEETWNPTTGCDQVSPGCTNCYALAMAKRLKAMGRPEYQIDGDPRTSGPGFGIAMHPQRLLDPFKWTHPTMVFVNSMSDLFHKGVTREFIAQVFATMALTPQHTYQVLTKRHTPMRSLLNDARFRAMVGDAARDTLADPCTPMSENARAAAADQPVEWPLPNLWRGVSVEDQTWAGRRIPELVDGLAAIRFLSCEPLLGPVDLAPWLPPRVPVLPDDAAPTWDAWTWDAWVPVDVRMAIEDFWPTDRGGPRAWLRDAIEHGSHAYGQSVKPMDGATRASGRWVHAWGNVGRLVHPNGSHSFASFTPEDVHEQRHIHWVIVGGESGPGARAMHPEWVRGLQRQTEAAGAAFFFKQTGTILAREWGAKGKGTDPSEWKVSFPQDFPDIPAPKVLTGITTDVGESA